MSLVPGTKLGPYEILSALGAGGMGEVYRARDPKLNRDVALKVLLPEVADNPERLARFRREAQTLASLNHPNIAHIHGLEESGGSIALVMELVEGEDLSQRIAHGAIPPDEALPIARQIAEALEAAHEQGIIHRDLKPANIKVRADGTVKVLDFGLAKAMGPASGSSPNVTQSPTLTTPAMTQAGMILGSAAYMSPEQARGTQVDKRADTWAFGVVLWEMLTGKHLFAGATVSDTVASVLKTEPDWTALAPATPTPIRRLLRRCLEKDRKRRLPDAADARLEIEEALTASVIDRTASTPLASSPARGTPVASKAAVVAAVLGMVAFAIPAVRHLREAPPAAFPETRVDIVTPASDQPAAFALSPDGRNVVFVASGDSASRLWLRSLATTTAQPLAGTEGATYPFWAPDGRAVGFFADGKLKRLDVASGGAGAPQTLAAAAVGRGGTWNADGVILFAPTGTSPLVRMPASGGSLLAVTTLVRQTTHKLPSFLPDGRHFLFYAQGTPDTAGIFLGALDAPDTHRLTAADTGGVFLPSVRTTASGSADAGARSEGGWLLWVRSGTLVAQRLNLAQAALTGEVVTLADPVVVDASANAAAVSASADGLVAYRTGRGNRQQLTWVDRSGKALGTQGAPDDSLLTPSVSPDGQRVAAARTVQGNTDLWLLDGPRATRLTFDAPRDEFAIWSPDGRQMAFASNRAGPRDLYLQMASGGSAEERLVVSPQTKIPTDWSADGRFLLYYSIDPQTNRDIWVLPLTGDRTPQTLLKTPFDERNGTFSPDGRWMAYQSNESGRDEIYVRPVVGTTPAGGQWQVSTNGGVFPRWRHDGRELYYLAPSAAMMAAPIAITGASVVPGEPVTLFPTRIVGGGADRGLGRNYDVTRDGRFLVNTELTEAAAPITLIQNWNSEAKN